MQTLYELKEQTLAETPLLLFECTLNNGQIERWCTHQVDVGGHRYEARVLRHNLFEVQTSSDQGVDAIPKVSVTLANADSHFSQIERTAGWKGAKIKVLFLFFDLRQRIPASESTVLFLGIANPPDEITESTFRLTAINRMSMQRVLLPQVRIQRRCPWEFPISPQQRTEGVSGGNKGRYSRFFRCGYSPDIEGGAGNLNGGAPYASCDYTRGDCEARGMFAQDNLQRPTRRFGGAEFVPSSILVRSYGEKGSHVSPVTENEARYNDFVPLIYGTAWYTPPIVFARNDGNLTHMEVLLGMGEIEGVLKVLVNDIEIPLGRAGTNMTGTGWFNVVSLGNRTGNFNLDFPSGDPYGSMAYLSLVVPNRINDGGSLPRVKVLIQGLRLPQYGADGAYLGDPFGSNPAWILLDILQRCGWSLDEIDLGSFAETAEYCAEEIQAMDLNGNPILIPRFQCNLVLQKRRVAGDLIRGIRNGSRLYVTYGAAGLLQLRVANSLALQQNFKPDWSNATETLDGGWPSYEFGDGTYGFSGILRRQNGEPSIRMWSRSSADTPNRFTIEFQDALNEYQQDSFSLADVDDIAKTGQEITAPLTVLGLPHYDQAGRILKFNLDQAIQGNTYMEFESSVKAFGLRPGDLITLTYLKEGFDRQPFRVLKIAPGVNYRVAKITAQIHKDRWYDDTNGSGRATGRRQPGAGVGLPRPLAGALTDENGDIQFAVTESARENTDGGLSIEATVNFLAPPVSQPSGPGIPLLNLAPSITAGGTLDGDLTLYYAVSALDQTGAESDVSFIVRAEIPPGPATNSVILSGLSFAPGTSGFHVYRGTNPAQMFRIATNQPPTDSFTDSGLAKQVSVPPDPNYDHANFYWRLEMQPEYPATIHQSDTIGNSALLMTQDSYRGMVVRITRGKGAGQERAVTSNSGTTLHVAPAWSVEPDATSLFVIAETGWHSEAEARTSPVQFSIPNRTGAVIHITGRAANIHNAEASPELAVVTRWVVGGAGHGDADVPPEPSFGLSPPRGGRIELLGVAFADLTNIRTITAGSLTLHYWDEMAGPTPYQLAAAVDTQETFLNLTLAGTALPGTIIQMEAEILRVEEVLNDGLRYRVTRCIHNSAAGPHASQTPIYHLRQKPVVVPFVRDFFGSPASGEWTYPITLPNARIASADFFVTNTKGNSPTATIAVTQTVDYGLRTLSGGQYSIQVEGFLAVQNDAAPDLVVEGPHSVRDIFAVVQQAPTGAPIQLQLKRDGMPYCSVTVPEGATVSTSANGFALPPLNADSRIGLDILAVGLTNPGSDLTVVIRL